MGPGLVLGFTATGVGSTVVVWPLVITTDPSEGSVVVVAFSPPRLRDPEAGLA